jgi:O-antigen/teichoic acid export membrane protein
MKASGVSMAFVLAYLAVFAPQAIGAWIGPGHDDVAELVRFLMPAEIVLCAAGPLTHVPVTFMRLRPAAVAICLLGAANVVGAVIVMEFTGLGVLGACMVWSLAMLALKMVAYPILASRMTGCSAMLFIRPILLSLALFAASAVALWGLSMVAEVQAGILSVALPAIVLFPAYAVLAARIAFDRDEKLVLASFLPEKLRRPVENIVGIRR